MPELDDYQVRFSGIARLYGQAGLGRLKAAHVCIVGVGGVGSWTAEALARSGVGRLTLIDLDEVCLSNVNRQLPALTSEVGKSKVRVLQKRVAGINPVCVVNPVEEFFTPASADRLLSPYHFLVDAIDSVQNKALLLARCRERSIPVITLAGAGGRQDPTAIRSADLAFSQQDRLLRAVRKLLRADYGFPRGEKTAFGIQSVYSTETPIIPQPDGTVCANRGKATRDLRMNCNGGYGSATFVTGAFGFVAAAHVIRAIATHA